MVAGSSAPSSFIVKKPVQNVSKFENHYSTFFTLKWPIIYVTSIRLSSQVTAYFEVCHYVLLNTLGIWIQLHIAVSLLYTRSTVVAKLKLLLGHYSNDHRKYDDKWLKFMFCSQFWFVWTKNILVCEPKHERRLCCVPGSFSRTCSLFSSDNCTVSSPVNRHCVFWFWCGL
jgi:hypothetical protein